MKTWQSDIIHACSEVTASVGNTLVKGLKYTARSRFPAVPSDAKVDRMLRDGALRPLPTTDTPKVSVIIPVYGKYATTYWCLDSLANTHCNVSYEVIVVDDCSPDATAQMLGQVQGVRVVHNHENLGFVRSCNAGAQAARGEFVCFLNNDTRVTDGWLDALLATFDDFPNAGMAGGMLLFPDGILQEAGGTVFKDGNCSHYGRNRDARRSEFNYARPVDYCSGACLVLRKSLFTQLGGFDLLYVPAYYEDTDLAFKVRAEGLEVIYQPTCKVVHYEGVTHGRNPAIGLKRHQTLNRAKLVERWGAQLQQHPAVGNRTWSAGERRLRPGVLALASGSLPAPNSVTGRRLLEVRAAGYRVALACAEASIDAFAQQWQAKGVEVLTGQSVASVVTRLRGAWSARYRHLAYVDSATSELARRIRRSAPHLVQWQLPGDDASAADACAGLDGVFRDVADIERV
jgi:O-antigen biosynthesis protein